MCSRHSADAEELGHNSKQKSKLVCMMAFIIYY